MAITAKASVSEISWHGEVHEISRGHVRTVHGCDVAEHAIRGHSRGDRIGQADLGLGQLVLVRKKDSDRV